MRDRAVASLLAGVVLMALPACKPSPEDCLPVIRLVIADEKTVQDVSLDSLQDSKSFAAFATHLRTNATTLNALPIESSELAKLRTEYTAASARMTASMDKALPFVQQREDAFSGGIGLAGEITRATAALRNRCQSNRAVAGCERALEVVEITDTDKLYWGLNALQLDPSVEPLRAEALHVIDRFKANGKKASGSRPVLESSALVETAGKITHLCARR